MFVFYLALCIILNFIQLWGPSEQFLCTELNFVDAARDKILFLMVMVYYSMTFL